MYKKNYKVMKKEIKEKMNRVISHVHIQESQYCKDINSSQLDL